MQKSPDIYEFPYPLSIKAIGEDRDDYLQFVIDTVTVNVGQLEENRITSRTSNGSKYLAMTVPFIAQDREQLDAVYRARRSIFEFNLDNRTRFVI